MNQYFFLPVLRVSVKLEISDKSTTFRTGDPITPVSSSFILLPFPRFSAPKTKRKGKHKTPISPFLFASADMLSTARSFKVAAGLVVAGGIAWQSNPNGSLYLSSAVDGVTRSSRALYTIGSIVVDYKYSLRSVPQESDEYKSKLSEIHLRSAKKLLELCEENRGFYVKAGQFVSAMGRAPKEYCSTLSSLQDQAFPCNFKGIKEVITSNLGKDLSAVFLSFDEKPIAAASIAQVHRGLLKDNREVAVKVQYPGLEQRMRIDILTMDTLSKAVSLIFPNYRFDQLVSQFRRAMSLELDFIQEAKNAERTAKNLRKNNSIIVPDVYWDLTTKQVLTMQFCSGHKVDDLQFLKDSGINPLKVAQVLMEAFAEMIFVHGFVHGDPHPGNILVRPEGRKGFKLVLLDHGLYRELGEAFRQDYCQLWKALILLDPQKIQQVGERFGVGKFAKFFPVIFTERTIDSKSALGRQMSDEEKKHLQQELGYLRPGDISSFMESLPPEFLSVLRTDGLLRATVSKLGASRRVRLLAYAKYAVYGLAARRDTEPDLMIESTFSRVAASLSYFRLRTLVEFYTLISKMEDLRSSLTSKLRRMLLKFIRFFYGTTPSLQS